MLGKVKEVVKCDVNRLNPLSGTILEEAKFDVITSCNCLQVATLTVETFEKALRNIRYTKGYCLCAREKGSFIVLADWLFWAVSSCVPEREGERKGI